MSYFRQSRNIELSLIYYLETQINTDWTGISCVKSFQQATKATLPVVTLRLIDNNPVWLEIGGNNLIDVYGIVIDIFATSDGQRLDLGEYVKEKLKVGCIYYEHSQTSGAPETLTRIANGRVVVLRFTEDVRVDFGEDVDSRDKFRHSIAIQVRKS